MTSSTKNPLQFTVQVLQPSQYQELKRKIYVIINVSFRSDDSWTNDRAFVNVYRIPINGEAEFDARCAEPNALLCAFDGDQIVGVIHILAQRNEALPNCLGVSPTHQSRGVGSLLI